MAKPFADTGNSQTHPRIHIKSDARAMVLTSDEEEESLSSLLSQDDSDSCKFTRELLVSNGYVSVVPENLVLVDS